MLEVRFIYSVCYVQWKWASNFAKQILRNGLQFVSRLHLQNPQWDWASSDCVYFKIADNQKGIKPFDRSSNHPV